MEELRKAFTKSRIGVYREQLTSREKRTVERTLGSLLTEYGYKLDPAVPHRLDWLITDIAQQRVYRLKHFIGSTEKFLDEKPVLEKRSAMGGG